MSDFEKEKNSGGSVSKGIKTFISIIIVTIISVTIGVAVTYATGTGGLRILGQGILDNASTPVLSIDPNNRQLVSASGTPMVTWANGNVGIGTTTPAVPLHVVGPANTIVMQIGSYFAMRSDGVLYFGGTTSANAYGKLTWDTGMAQLYGQTGKALSLGSNGNTSTMYIDTTGNVGIGTTTPGEKLSVNGTLGVLGGNSIKFYNTNNNGWATFSSNANGDLNATAGASTGSNILLQGANNTTFQTYGGGVWNTKMVLLNNGNVGIGTTSPQAKLSIKGTGLTTGQAFLITDSSDNPKFTVTDAGNVTVQNTGGTASLTMQGGSGDSSNSQINHYGSAAGTYTGRLGFRLNYGSGTYAEVMSITNLGNVGIGTTGPLAKLSVGSDWDSIYLGRGTAGGADKSWIGFNAYADAASWHTKNLTYDGIVTFGYPSTTDTQTYYEIGFVDQADNSYSTGMRIRKDGNVGIGTTTPGYPLEVTGSAKISTYLGVGINPNTGYSIAVPSNGITIANAGVLDFGSGNSRIKDGGSSYYLGFQTYNAGTGTITEKMRLDTNGYLGIGTTNPVMPLQIKGYGGFDGNANEFMLSSNIYYSGGWKHITSGYSSQIDMRVDTGDIKFLTVDTGATDSAATLSEKMRILNGGNVGIGTTTPGYPLTVAGDVNFTGTLRQNGTAFGSSQWTSTSTGVYYNGGNVGIGTAGPGNKLRVSGAKDEVLMSLGDSAGSYGSTYLQQFYTTGTNRGLKILNDAQDKSWTFQTNGDFTVDNGNVGIGTAAPGTFYRTTNAGADQPVLLGLNNSNGARIGFTAVNISNSDLYFIQPNASSNNIATGLIRGGMPSNIAGAETGYLTFSTKPSGGAVAEAMRIDTSGNVGIGTTGPQAKLNVRNDNASTNIVTDSNATFAIDNYDTTANNFASFWFRGAATGSVTSWNAGIGATFTRTNGGAGLWFANRDTITGALAQRMYIAPGGNVGIGTTSPAAQLAVQGNGTNAFPLLNLSTGAYDGASIIQFTPANTHYNWQVGAQVNTNQTFQITPSTVVGGTTFSTPAITVLGSNGNVGIGTTGPSYPLTVSAANGSTFGVISTATSSNSAGAGLLVYSDDGAALASGDRFGQIVFGGSVNAGHTLFNSSSISSFTTEAVVGGASFGSKMSFFTTTNGAAGRTEKLTILDSGNVGIGTTSPTNTLTVATGSINVLEKVLTAAGSMTIDWRAGNQQLIRISTTGITMTFTNYAAGQNLKLVVCNPDAGTPGTITWPGVITWSGGSVPTQTLTNSKCDIWSFIATMGTSTLNVFGAQSPEF